MKKETFIDNMTERGYELKYSRNGNITATKGANTVRYVPLADYIVCVSTPTMTATPRRTLSERLNEAHRLKAARKMQEECERQERAEEMRRNVVANVNASRKGT